MWKGALLALFSYGLQAYARPTLARSTVHAARRGPTNAPARYARGESLAAYTFARLTTTCALEALVPEWTNFCRAAAPHNPFAHPLWMTTWARHFVTPNDLYVITMRGKAGELVAVAPFYRRHIAVGPSVIETRLHLLGAGQHTSLTELPQIVIQPGLERAVLRGLVGYLGAHAADWDWIELALTPEQGWLEPEWLPRNGAGQGSFGLHKATRPCVVLPLPCSLEALQGGLKRNVKESLRRGANSLTRAGYNWEVTTPETLTDLTRSLNTLVDLHRSRARLEGVMRHDDYVAHHADRAFLHDIARRLFPAGAAQVLLLRVDGTPTAGRLLLHGHDATFLSLSGFDPAWWTYNVATTLTVECLRRAVARGNTSVNLSSGPDVAKLRWSEHLEMHQVFVVVGPRRRSQLAFTMHWQLRAAHHIRRESRRFGGTKTGAKG